MSAEGWAAIAGLAVEILVLACGLAWRLGRVEQALRALNGDRAGNARDHVEFRRDITTLRERLARLQPRPLGP